MVKVKIQNIDDIIYAYFKALGYKNKDGITEFMSLYPFLLNSKNIIKDLDDIVYKLVKSLFSHNRFSKQQALSFFKSEFILHDMASLIGKDLLLSGFNDSELIKQVQFQLFDVVPKYKMSEMPTQKI